MVAVCRFQDKILGVGTLKLENELFKDANEGTYGLINDEDIKREES